MRHDDGVWIEIPKDKIALVIGPGGSTIKDIIQKTETNININDEGEHGIATISGVNADGLKQAIETIENLTKDAKVGEIYEGEVKKIMEFGAFVAIGGKKEGLVHISKITDKRVDKVEDVLKVGDTVKVKVIEIRNDGKINLTMKDIEEKE